MDIYYGWGIAKLQKISTGSTITTSGSVCACNYVVITAAAGFNLQYDKSIWHYKYPLQDIKTQNIQKYFEEVGEKINKGNWMPDL